MHLSEQHFFQFVNVLTLWSGYESSLSASLKPDIYLRWMKHIKHSSCLFPFDFPAGIFEGKHRIPPLPPNWLYQPSTSEDICVCHYDDSLDLTVICCSPACTLGHVFCINMYVRNCSPGVWRELVESLYFSAPKPARVWHQPSNCVTDVFNLEYLDFRAHCPSINRL